MPQQSPPIRHKAEDAKDAPVVKKESTTTDQAAERAAGKQALKDLLAPVRGRLLSARILAALSGILAIAPYIALVQLGDTLLRAAMAGTPVDAERARFIVFVLISTFGLRLFLYLLALGITHFADLRLGDHIRGQMISRLSRAPLSWFTATNAGRVRKALQDDIAQVHTLIAHQPVEATAAVVTPIALATYAFVVDWRLGLLAIATLPLYALANVWMMQGMGEKTVEMDSKLAVVSSTMIEFVSGISVVKAFGTVGRSHAAYQRAADEFSRFYLAWVTPLLRGSAASDATVSIPILLLVNLAGGAAMVHAGWVEPADVLATSLISLVLPAAIQTISENSWAYQLTGAAALRIMNTLDTPVLERVHSTKGMEGTEGTKRTEQEAVPRDNTVEYRDVSFAYGDGPLAVQDVSVTLPAGTVTALIGPSGSGKSTLATLLARFADPTSGSILLGGVDLRDLDPSTLYQRVAFVLQEPQLLRVSLRDNIALGKPEASEDEIRRAAEHAQILDFIDSLPKGMDTIYGEESNLSGGQAQRIAIARALLIDAPVLILDEATAFADPESQADIQEALSTLVTGRTVLVIAHRPESVIGVDQIVVMTQGRIAAVGSHEQLLDEPHYARLWKSAQVRITEPETTTSSKVNTGEEQR
ncbi:ABC transporter ATP-binding protein [Corynebacterium flavescens]